MAEEPLTSLAEELYNRAAKPLWSQLMLSLYEYKTCSTCRKAKKFLKDQGIEFQTFEIDKNPPSIQQISEMAKAVPGGVKKLFNTSGGVYRELGLKDRLADMPEYEMFELLSKNGMLIKRPFLQSGTKGTVGFKEPDWLNLLEALKLT